MPDLLEDAEQNLTSSLRTLPSHLWQDWQSCYPETTNLAP
jgi:hypothetical protein